MKNENKIQFLWLGKIMRETGAFFLAIFMGKLEIEKIVIIIFLKNV
jgi:hypothetical protein